MKEIVATSESYNKPPDNDKRDLSHYADNTSKTYELLTDSKTAEEDFDLVKDIATRINKALKED